ncbi:MAG: hypothetical protein AAGN46_17180, partial [Acidobacteriota bacterium]
ASPEARTEAFYDGSVDDLAARLEAAARRVQAGDEPSPLPPSVWARAVRRHAWPTAAERLDRCLEALIEAPCGVGGNG